MPGFFDASPGQDRRSQSCIAHRETRRHLAPGFFGSAAPSPAYLAGFNFLSKKLVNQAKTQSMRIIYRLPLMLLILLNLVLGLLIFKALGLQMSWRHRFLNAGKAVFLGMMGIKIRLREGSAPREAAILMANHRSYIDVLFFR